MNVKNQPTSSQTLRTLLASRQFPADIDGEPRKHHQVQVASDRLREKLAELGTIMIGLVPDAAYHSLVVDVLHDLAIVGERELCAIREVTTEHADLRILGALISYDEPQAEEAAPEPSTTTPENGTPKRRGKKEAAPSTTTPES